MCLHIYSRITCKGKEPLKGYPPKIFIVVSRDTKCINIKFHRTQHRSSLNEWRVKCQLIPLPIFYFLFSNCANSRIRSSFTRLASLAFVSSPTAGTWACYLIPFPPLLNCLISDTKEPNLNLHWVPFWLIISFHFQTNYSLCYHFIYYLLINDYYAIDAMYWSKLFWCHVPEEL